MSNGKAIAPFGGGPAGVLDLAAEVAGGIAPPDPAVTVAARAAAPLLASLPPAQLRDTIEKVIMQHVVVEGPPDERDRDRHGQRDQRGKYFPTRLQVHGDCVRAYRKIAPAVATFSESAPADIGIVTR